MQTKTNARSLPKGWRWVKLGDICEFTYGESLPARARQSDGKVPVYGSNGIVGYHNQAVTSGPTIIIGRKGSIGEVHFSKVDCFPIDTTYYIERPKLDTDLIWLFYGLKYLKLQNLNRAAAVPGLNREDAYTLEIPIPPLDEQRRIASRLNEQLAAVESARKAAEEQLQAAWQLPSAYLREVFDDNHFKKWHWDKLGRHVSKIGSGITPSGGQASYLRSGIPLIRSQNVHMNRFSYDGLAFISKEQDEAMAGSRVLPNDVLLNITGASIGRVTVVPKELGPANVNQHVSIIRCDDKIIPEFLSLYISRPDFQKSILDMQAGATRQALTKALIENFDIPMPDTQEQKSIVDLLHGKMKETDVLIESLESQLAEIESLPASLLREAFAGQL